MNCPQEDELMEGLRALAAVSKDEQAPPGVEENLLRAFRQRSAQAPRPVRRGPWMAVAAAGSVAAAAGLLWLRPAPHLPTAVAPKVEIAAAPVAVAPPQASEPVRAVAPRRVRKKPRPARLLRTPQPVVEVGTDFLPVAQGDEWTPLDGARLMRVELPKSALRVFGLPVNEEREPERVQADVMLSDDGLLRAIRFVQ